MSVVRFRPWALRGHTVPAMWQAFVLAVLIAAPDSGSSGARAPLAFVGVSVVDVRAGKLKSHRTVVISGGRISRVDDGAPPAGAQVVDGSSLFVLPGLWDLHAHTRSDARTREVVFPLDVANGVTGIRDMQGDCLGPTCAEDKPDGKTAAGWRKDIEGGTLLGPRIIASSPWLDGRFAREPGTYAIHDAAEGRAAVRDARARGAAFLKIYSTLDRSSFLAIAAEARRVGIRFAGHVPVSVSAIEAAQVGMWSEDHLFGIEEACAAVGPTLRREREELLHRTDATGEALWTLFYGQIARLPPTDPCPELTDALRRAGTAIVPTLNFWRSMYLWDLPENGQSALFRFLPAEIRKEWAEYLADKLRNTSPEKREEGHRDYEHRLHTVALLWKAGVRVLPGTDTDMPFTVPGFDLHRELLAFQTAGLRPADVLRSATLHAAQFLRMPELGEVAPGKLADLVLVRANPLTDIRNVSLISGVVIRGQYLDRAALDRLLEEAAAFAER